MRNSFIFLKYILKNIIENKLVRNSTMNKVLPLRWQWLVWLRLTRDLLQGGPNSISSHHTMYCPLPCLGWCHRMIGYINPYNC